MPHLELTTARFGKLLRYILEGNSFSRHLMNEKKSSSILTNVTKHISYLDRQYATSPSAKLYKERLCLQTEFDYLFTFKAEEKLLKSRHEYYEYGDKPNRLLSHQVRQSSASQIISEINASNGFTCDPQEIMFRLFTYHFIPLNKVLALQSFMSF